LIAINANNGEVIWQTKVSNPDDGFTITGAPLIVDNSVVIGLSGGEYGVRGFLAAYDAETVSGYGSLTQFPDRANGDHDPWENDAWRTGGGPKWVTGSYDPSLGLLFCGVGNPLPVYLGDVRPGDNLFTNSVIALRAESGKLAWYFQFTPHDEHDWDAAQTPILADIFIGGVNRTVVVWPNRNGFYYVLDRTSGEFLLGVPFVEQNWASGLDAGGRPILTDVGNVTIGGHLTSPSVAGATNWQPSAFDPKQGLVFIPAIEGASIFTKSSQPTGASTASSSAVALAAAQRQGLPSPLCARWMWLREQSDGSTAHHQVNRAISVACWQPRVDWFSRHRVGRCSR
jgi:alcohol dehydrogenase (cytochrome c)